MSATIERPTLAPGSLEVREVRAADPALSPHTNERLTLELREVLGTDQVRVPPNRRPHAGHGERPPGRSMSAFISMNWLSVLFGLAIWLTVGGVIALATDNWWFLPLAAGIHALGTTIVMLTSIRLMSVSEHPSPSLAAAMSFEGIRAPDARFSQMVEEFRTGPTGTVGEVLSPGHDDRPTPTTEDPARAGAEQAAAITPTAGPSRSVRAVSAADYVTWGVGLGLVLFSVAIPPAFGGGWLWLTTAVIVPVVAAAGVLQWLMLRRPDSAQIRSIWPIVLTVVLATLAVAGGCAVIAAVYHGNGGGYPGAL